MIQSAGIRVTAEQPAAPDTFQDVAFLVGRWEGQSDGQPGTGTVRREYERVLSGKFIRVHNTSTYAPQPKNPKGEGHQDLGYFSRDGARQRLVLRQFHIEGFVNQYAWRNPARTGHCIHGHVSGACSPSLHDTHGAGRFDGRRKAGQDKSISPLTGHSQVVY